MFEKLSFSDIPANQTLIEHYFYMMRHMKGQRVCKNVIMRHMEREGLKVV